MVSSTVHRSPTARACGEADGVARRAGVTDSPFYIGATEAEPCIP